MCDSPYWKRFWLLIWSAVSPREWPAREITWWSKVLPLCICTVVWFDVKSTAPSINARPGKSTPTLIQVITRCVFSHEAKLLTRRQRYFMFWIFVFIVRFRLCCGCFVSLSNSRQYSCRSVSTVLVCWFEIQVLDAVKWLLSAFSIGRVVLFFSVWSFFLN